MMSNTERELRRRIQEAGFRPITVTMKCNGDDILITPCVYKDVDTGAEDANSVEVSFDDVEYYLMDSPSIPLYGNETLDGVARTLLRYAEMLEEQKSDVKALKEHIIQHGVDSDWGFVSDYHKDLFGHRPHVGADQLIAWAYSNYDGSARFFA